jgi:hypothetical protein
MIDSTGVGSPVGLRLDQLMEADVWSEAGLVVGAVDDWLPALGGMHQLSTELAQEKLSVIGNLLSGGS